MSEKLDLDAWEAECDPAIALTNDEACYQRKIIALISRIRELESASQSGGGEASGYDAQIEKWRLDSEELEAFHMSMDKHGVPRATKFGVQMSAFGRAVKFAVPSAGNGGAEG